MTTNIGAPGDGIGRREFLAATGTVGVTAAAGCTALSDPGVKEVDPGAGRQRLGSDLPTTEGSSVEVTLENTMSMPHTVHFHGSQTAWKDDGVPTTTDPERI